MVAQPNALLERVCREFMLPEAPIYEHLLKLARGLEPDISRCSVDELRELAAGCIQAGSHLVRTRNSRECIFALALVNDECERLRKRARELRREMV